MSAAAPEIGIDVDLAISVRDMRVALGGKTVLDGLDFDIAKGNITGVIGPSGCGKSVSMRALLGLVPIASGTVRILGRNPDDTAEDMPALRREMGVLFQQGALFSSLTVQENVELPMREHLGLDSHIRARVARAKIEMTGLPLSAAGLYPSELSGGMIKRAGLARALALDPQVLFLDEPTAGLDPIAAAGFDDLVLELHKSLGLTVYMITHDLDSLGAICNDVLAFFEGRVVCHGPLDEVRGFGHPWIKEYFGGPRARRLGE